MADTGDARYARADLNEFRKDMRRKRKSLRAALIDWAEQAGEGEDYTDNEPLQCMHPLGHWYEVPNLLRNGTLHAMLQEEDASALPAVLEALQRARGRDSLSTLTRHLEHPSLGVRVGKQILWDLS